MGAAGSVNKVFWSELDIALHETALDLLGPEAELESAVDWTATCSRCPARSTPAPTRSSATSSPSGSSACPASRGSAADEVRAHRRPARLRRRRSTSCWPAPTPSAAARAWADGRPRARAWLWARLAEQGVTDCWPTEATAGRARASPSRRSAGTPCPGPWVESAAYLPRRAGPRGRGRRDRRRAAARAVRARRRRRRRGVRRRPTARAPAAVGDARRSVDPTRRLFEVDGRRAPVDVRDRRSAFDLAVAGRVGPAARRAASGCWPTRSPT